MSAMTIAVAVAVDTIARFELLLLAGTPWEAAYRCKPFVSPSRQKVSRRKKFDAAHAHRRARRYSQTAAISQIRSYGRDAVAGDRLHDGDDVARAQDQWQRMPLSSYTEDPLTCRSLLSSLHSGHWIPFQTPSSRGGPYCPASSVTNLPVSNSLHTCLSFVGIAQTICESCLF